MLDVSELITSLPAHLSERASVERATTVSQDGHFVLYWLRTAIRAGENPALDVALAAGKQLGLPVFVYQGLSERYPYASDRLHTFILAGACDLQGQMRQRGIGYAFHLERPGHRGPHLKTLAARAALVVTEDMPVAPLRQWTEGLQRKVAAPVVTVDTACVAPMKLLGRAYDRAFQFRNATRELYGQRLTRAWPDEAIHEQIFVPKDLPFEPVELSWERIPELVAECEIDHGIGPVPHTAGGSAAGYRRWDTFRQHGLLQYHRGRNDALRDGVSRMSPYLHFGMVSPLRIAREAASLSGPGPEKYLDELLIWRELAYVFCRHREDYDQISALPAWAQDTLQMHEADRRPELYSWETLARGRTGDTLWDAAQRSLLIHGELHNNVRMTWGKAVLGWTPTAADALATLIDLNHRYALDGRDPSSYGGILWCLGQFDRPFPPEREVLGTVRQRTTQAHATRLDPHAYLRKTTRPLRDPMPSVAVVGGGISGLMCARTLSDHGYATQVFEKSRGVGGRMATRRTPDFGQFDHGAQYFTVRNEQFRRYVSSWLHDGCVASWEGRIVTLDAGQITAEKNATDRFVAVPAMNAVCRHLASCLEVSLETPVRSIYSESPQWRLAGENEEDLGAFDVVVITAPAPQTAQLLAHTAPQLAEMARNVTMRGCWALMVALPEPLEVGFDGAFVSNSPLSWIARNSGKPGRGPLPDRWVLHATPEWSEEHLEEDSAHVATQLMEAFWSAVGHDPVTTSWCSAHRWRYALPPEPLAHCCLFDTELQLGACGDWCAGPRVEGAFLSGVAMAGRVMGCLTGTEPPEQAKQQELFE